MAEVSARCFTRPSAGFARPGFFDDSCMIIDVLSFGLDEIRITNRQMFGNQNP